MTKRGNLLDEELRQLWGVEGEELSRLETKLGRLGEVRVPSRLIVRPARTRLQWAPVSAMVALVIVLVVLLRPEREEDVWESFNEGNLVEFDAFGEEFVMLEELI